MPKATTYQGDFLFPRKKAAFSPFPAVCLAIIINTKKYITITEMIIDAFIKQRKAFTMFGRQ